MPATTEITAKIDIEMWFRGAVLGEDIDDEKLGKSQRYPKIGFAITKSESSSFRVGGLKESVIAHLLTRKIPEKTQLSITQLLDLPTYEFRRLLRAIERVYQNEQEIARALEKDAKKTPLI